MRLPKGYSDFLDIFKLNYIKFTLGSFSKQIITEIQPKRIGSDWFDVSTESTFRLAAAPVLSFRVVSRSLCCFSLQFTRAPVIVFPVCAELVIKANLLDPHQTAHELIRSENCFLFVYKTKTSVRNMRCCSTALEKVFFYFFNFPKFCF